MQFFDAVPSRRALAIKQFTDPHIDEIRNTLEQGEVKDSDLRDGLVYEKLKEQILLFYVPITMENAVIRSCHNEIGHI